MVAGAIIAPVVATGVVVVTVFKKLKSTLVHVLYIVDNLPEYTFEGWWSGEAPAVKPPFSKINVGQKLLEIQATTSLLIFHIVITCRKLFLFNNLVHVFFEKVHELYLISG